MLVLGVEGRRCDLVVIDLPLALHHLGEFLDIVLFPGHDLVRGPAEFHFLVHDVFGILLWGEVLVDALDAVLVNGGDVKGFIVDLFVRGGERLWLWLLNR